jgi:hypothetical protein
VKTTDAAIGSAKEVFGASVEIARVLMNKLATNFAMWTAVSDKIKANINEQSTPILGVKSSDTRLCSRGEARLSTPPWYHQRTPPQS